MNESGPKNPEQAVSLYESKVKKEYGELGKEGVEIENWGTMISPSGERFNGYSDKRFIEECFTEPIHRLLEGKGGKVSIADLGGDDGYLLNEVVTELKMKEPSIEANGLVVDIDSTGKARRKFAEKQKTGERKDIEYVVADITKLPFDNETLNVIISRMTMQYLDKEQQELFLKEISRVLKKEGLCIIQTVTDEISNKDFNQVWMQITKLISKSSDFKRSFPWFGEHTKYMQFFERYNLLPVFGSRFIKFPFSISAFVERFSVDTHKLGELFEVESKKFPELFETIDGQLCLKARLLNLRLKKVENPMNYFQQQRAANQ